MAILAVYSFNLLIEKRHYSNEKKSHSFDMMYGKTRVACGLSFRLFPYMNIFLRREWPCRSQYSTTSRSLANALTHFFVFNMTG